MNIAITGASGYIGSRLTEKMSVGPHKLRCLVRDKVAFKQRFHGKGIDIGECNLLSSETVSKKLQNIDTAFYLVHSLASDNDFDEDEITCARNFLNEAKNSGVKRIIYLGGLTTQTGKLSKHLSSRLRVGELLRSSSVECIEFQASIIIGKGGLSYEIMKSLVERLPAMITPKWVSSLAQPIWIEDVVDYLSMSADSHFNGSKIIQIGGPDKVSYKDLMKEYGHQRGINRAMISVPVLTPHLSSLWLGLVTPVYARAGRKLINSLTTDSVVTERSGMEMFPITPVTYKKAIQHVLEDSETGPVSRWFDANSSASKTPKGVGFGSINLSDFKYKFEDTRFIDVDSNALEAIKPINEIGGCNGWYFANILWRIRGWFDLLVGGVGMRRSRLEKDKFIIGDTLDWWRIIDTAENRMVTFLAEMKLPGEATLKFEVETRPTTTRIWQTASFYSNSFTGYLYWYSLLPLHAFIFKGMIRSIGAKVFNSTPSTN